MYYNNSSFERKGSHHGKNTYVNIRKRSYIFNITDCEHNSNAVFAFFISDEKAQVNRAYAVNGEPAVRIAVPYDRTVWRSFMQLCRNDKVLYILLQNKV